MPYDVDAAVKHLDENAQPFATFKCAAYVRQALEAGGLDMSARPVSAKSYGPYLVAKGFRSQDLKDYKPMKGDVAVIQSYKGGGVHGHIAMYDGAQWVSDFKQVDMWGGSGYRKFTPSYEVYRP